MREERIIFRIDINLRNTLVSYALKNKITVSRLIRDIIYLYFDKKVPKRELTRGFKEHLRERKFLKELYNIKVYMRYVYQLNNVLRHIKNVGLSTRKSGYDVNTEIIKEVIRKYWKLYLLFPPELKKLMRNEFISLANFGNKEEIIKLMNSFERDNKGGIWYKRK